MLLLLMLKAGIQLHHFIQTKTSIRQVIIFDEDICGLVCLSNRTKGFPWNVHAIAYEIKSSKENINLSSLKILKTLYISSHLHYLYIMAASKLKYFITSPNHLE